MRPYRGLGLAPCLHIRIAQFLEERRHVGHRADLAQADDRIAPCRCARLAELLPRLGATRLLALSK